MTAEPFYALTGGSLSAIGAAVLLWALFRDRSRGRLRCPKCWYRLDGVPADDDGLRICPECGRSNLSARHLTRTRRRKRGAAVAVLLLAAGWGIWNYPQARARGLWSYAPTTVLILLRDLAYEYGWNGSEVGAELLQRVYDGNVSSWHVAAIEPPGMREMLTLPRGDDTVWPEGVPLLVKPEPPGWMFLDAETGGPSRRLEISAPGRAFTVRIRADDHALSPFMTLSTEGDSTLWERSAGFWISTTVLEGDALTTADAAAVFTWMLDAGAPDRLIWTGRRELPVTVVPLGAPDLGLEPRRSASLDALVASGVITGVDPEAQSFSLLVGPCRDPLLSDVTLGIRAEVLLDGRAIASLRFAAPPGGLSEIDPAAPDLAPPRALPITPGIPTADLLAIADRITLRLHPDVGALVYHGLSGPYWDGDITIPLNEVLAR